MDDWVAYVMAAVLTMPIPFMIVLYILSRKMFRYKRKAFHRTIAWTTPVFILSVHVLLLVLFNQSFAAYIIIFLLLLLGLSMIIQFKLHDELKVWRAWKGFCRGAFLLFAFFYIGLSLYGIGIRIFS